VYMEKYYKNHNEEEQGKKNNETKGTCIASR
jgi:hypothetical protein